MTGAKRLIYTTKTDFVGPSGRLPYAKEIAPSRDIAAPCQLQVERVAIPNSFLSASRQLNSLVDFPYALSHLGSEF